MALLDVRAIHAAYEMNLCAAVPNIPMHVIVCEWSLDFVAVLLCLVLAPLSESLLIMNKIILNYKQMQNTLTFKSFLNIEFWIDLNQNAHRKIGR